MQLICLCYWKLVDSRFIEKKETLELLDENYKKIAVTNLKINIDLNRITENQVKDIISKDAIINNIDKIIWYLYNERVVS